MKLCPDCNTYSIAGDGICLNCHVRWKEVTKYKIGKKAAIYLIMLSVALIYCSVSAWFFLQGKF